MGEHVGFATYNDELHVVYDTQCRTDSFTFPLVGNGFVEGGEESKTNTPFKNKKSEANTWWFVQTSDQTTGMHLLQAHE